MPFWGAVRIRTSTGNYVSPVEDTNPTPVMGDITNPLATHTGGYNVTVECDYEHPTTDALQGFLVWSGSLPMPDWDNAQDVGLTGGDSGSPIEHFTWNITVGAVGTVYFAIRAYGVDGLTSDSTVFSISVIPDAPSLNNPYDVNALSGILGDVDIQWKYEHPTNDLLEGFKVWISDTNIPDWDEAYDNGLDGGDSGNPIQTFNLSFPYANFGTTYVIIQSYGGGETHESEVFEFEREREKVLFPASLVSVATISGDLEVTFDYDWASYVPPVDDVNILEGFLVYIGTSEIPDWDNAFDNELNNGTGKPAGGGIETFNPLIPYDEGVIYGCIRSYGEGLTVDTPVFRLFAQPATVDPEHELNVDAPLLDRPLRQRTQLVATPTGHTSPNAWIGDRFVGYKKIINFGNVVGTGLTTISNNGYVLSVNTLDIRTTDNLWTGENTFDNLIIGDSQKIWFVKDPINPINDVWIEFNPTDNQFELYPGKLFLPGGDLITDEVNASVVNSDNFYGDGSGITDITLPQLEDVTITTPTSGQSLMYNGTEWVNSAVTGFVPTTRNINTGLGLTGGGNLSSDRTIAIDTAVVPQLGVNNTFTGSNSFANNVSIYDGGFDPSLTIGGGTLTWYDPALYFDVSISASSFIGDGSALTGITLDQLDDVTLSSPTTGQVLTYNGTAWVNRTFNLSGVATILSSTDSITVNTSAIATIDVVIVTYQGSSTGSGALFVDNIVNGTSFRINRSSIVAFDATVNWMIIKA